MGNQQTESQQSPYRPNYLWAAFFFGLLLVFLAYGIDRFLGVLALLLVVGSLAFTSLKPQYRIKGCVWLVSIVVLLVVVIPNGTPVTIKYKNAEVNANLHIIQLGLEKYATDHGCYPSSIQALLAAEGGYLPKLPRNPFKRNQPTDSQVPWIAEWNSMYPINETGWPGDWNEHAGDFFYFPKIEQVDGELVTTGYDLLALGAKIQNWNRETMFHKKSTAPILHLAGGLPETDEELP